MEMKQNPEEFELLILEYYAEVKQNQEGFELLILDYYANKLIARSTILYGS